MQLYPNSVVVDAAYHSRSARAACLEGTRQAIIARLLGWKDEPNARPICWLSGPAGYGKSAVAQTVAERCARDGTLLASFCFWRNAGGRGEFSRFITTIAYQITVSVPEVKPFVEKALRDDPSIVHQSTSNQLQKLIIEPLMSVPSFTSSSREHVIVIDALDECNDQRAIQDFIGIIASACSEWSLPLRWLLTSRNEYHIHKAFSRSTARDATLPFALGDFHALSDIRMFLTSRFSTIIRENPGLLRGVPFPWPSKEDMEALVEKSDGVFIFASTLVDFITDDTAPPDLKLKAVLALHDGLDPLYEQVLRAVPKIACFRSVLAIIMLVQKQPSINTVAGLLELSSREVLHALMPIQSIVRIPADEDYPIQLNHTSLRDFLVDQSRSRDLFIGSPKAHFIVALNCIKLMNRTLRRDEFPSDEASTYAAEYWLSHLLDSDISSELVPGMINSLTDFMSSPVIEVWINITLKRFLDRTISEILGDISSNCNVCLCKLGSGVTLICTRKVTDWTFQVLSKRSLLGIKYGCFFASTLCF